jgi:CDP-diacylglycerol---serine O-phosphatidyltransferase
MPAVSPTTLPRRSIAETMTALRAAGKPSHHAPLYSRLVNRPLGRRLAAVAARAGWTPNQVTALSGILTFTGIGLVAAARPTPGVGILVALLLMAGYALDSADGQLARLRGGGTLTGEWLDHMIDCTKGAALHVAVLVSLHRYVEPEHSLLLLLPIAFGLVTTVMFFGTVLTEQLRRGAGGTGAAATSGRSALRSFVTAPADHGLLCVTFVLLGWLPAFLTVYAVLFAGTAAYLAAGLVRWHRQLAALDAAR